MAKRPCNPNDPNKKKCAMPYKTWYDIPDSTPVGHLKIWVNTHAPESGVICPVCKCIRKDKSPPFNKMMAKSLLAIYDWFQKNPDEQWMRVEAELIEHYDDGAYSRVYPKLEHWKLLERKQGSNEYDPTNPNSGFWRLTDLGLKFAQNPGYLISRYVTMVKRGGKYRPADWSAETISLIDALENDFNFLRDVRGPVIPPGGAK